MHPTDSMFLDCLKSDFIRYVIPVYQRMYSWQRDNCEQLWKDIIAVGESEGGRHFTGSIVWVHEGASVGLHGVKALLIDGQQRMTTLSLLLVALADYGKRHGGIGPDGLPLEYRWKKIVVNYLLFDEEFAPGDPMRYNLSLSEEDNATFHSLIDELLDDSTIRVRTSDRITENYELFLEMLESYSNPNIVWRGIRRLQIIGVALEQGVDNPQAIFESMNSTGRDLSAADLVRNYILMGLPVVEQERLYRNYWREIEKIIGSDDRDERFDSFLKDYLTVVLAPEPINLRDVYAVFKRRVISNDWTDSIDIEPLLDELLRYARYYARITSGAEKDQRIAPLLANLNRFGVGVVNPLLMEFLDASDPSRGCLTDQDLVELLRITESYLVRRAVCEYVTNSLGRFFPSIINKLRGLKPNINYRAAFCALLSSEDGTARCFPDNAEFSHALRTRNIYGFRKALYLLNRLENAYHPKNPIDFSNGQYSIEHIMPQNALAHPEWIQALGGAIDAERLHGELLHTLGNLTVTAFNAELSDGTFEEKKMRMVGGYDHDAVALSNDCRNLTHWNAETIIQRSETLSEWALEVWPMLHADDELVEMLSKKPKVSGIGETATLKDLVAEHYIPIGAKLFHDSGKGIDHAVILEGAKVQIENGEIFNSPSMAAIRSNALRTGTKRSRNGWSYWRIDEEGHPKLNDVRMRYRRDHGLDQDMSDWDTWHIVFWQGFYDLASNHDDFCDSFGDLSERGANRSYSCSLPTRMSGRRIVLQVLTRKKNLGVNCAMYFDEPEDYRKIHSDQSAIMDQIGNSLEPWTWDDPDIDKKTRCFFVHHHIDVNDEDEREKAYRWMIDMTWRFRTMLG
ncbi:MAG: DUF262 domain-containing protein [Collinsella sp.]|nr:DUF262 domain-containing protein [Collinsella sp.]